MTNMENPCTELTQQNPSTALAPIASFPSSEVFHFPPMPDYLVALAVYLWSF